ncbi:MAG: hypothetical protein M3O30_00465 [Planctomycetota bacterium]|nr:hypothetical protein [Planctomycetota bacterium]
MRRNATCCLNLLLLMMLAACSQSRVITITTRPPDAQLSIDGIDRGPAPVTDKLVFKNSQSIHVITATRSGYQDQTLTLTRDDASGNVEIDLKPFSRRFTFITSPVPAVISINGVPLTSEAVARIGRDLDFTKDEHDAWTQYTVTAARPGFQTVQQTLTWVANSPTADILLQLLPMRKDLSIDTTPSGATITIDGDLAGITPFVDKGREFNFDPQTNQFIPHRLRIVKPGYDPIEQTISWDGGKTDYRINLLAKIKTIHIATDPAGASVMIDNNPAAPGPDGVPTAQLTFTPINEKGDLPIFTATISKRTAETEWYPTTMPITWEDGRTDYSATLKEVKSRLIPLLGVAMTRNSDGVWEVNPRESDTLAMKDVSEGPGKEPPALIYSAPLGASIGTIAVSPTGLKVLFTLLSGKTRADLRSQVYSIGADGTGGVEQITDGKALDIMPAFTPDGDQIVFSSNRAGRRLNIWRKSILGGAGIEQLTNTEEQDLWPMIDAGPHPRLFYEALSDSQPDAQLYEAPVEGGPRLDLTTISVGQPRISPKADSIAFTSVNSRTSNREIYRIPDKGGPPVNLTNDPDSDCYDPVWSKEGSQIAYVSDRGVAYISDRGLDEDRRRNADIWIMDLANADKPIQVTTNGSVDDSPAWDPTGSAIYFRSNRGGRWGIWRIAVK